MIGILDIHEVLCYIALNGVLQCSVLGLGDFFQFASFQVGGGDRVVLYGSWCWDDDLQIPSLSIL